MSGPETLKACSICGDPTEVAGDVCTRCELHVGDADNGEGGDLRATVRAWQNREGFSDFEAACTLALGAVRHARVLVLMVESGFSDWHGRDAEEIEEAIYAAQYILGPEAVEDVLTARVVQLNGMPYAEYLRTEEWQDVRHFALRRAEGRCQACNSSRRLEVHHRTYERRGMEKLADVTVLCREHHALFHGKEAW